MIIGSDDLQRGVGGGAFFFAEHHFLTQQMTNHHNHMCFDNAYNLHPPLHILQNHFALILIHFFHTFASNCNTWLILPTKPPQNPIHQPTPSTPEL